MEMTAQIVFTFLLAVAAFIQGAFGIGSHTLGEANGMFVMDAALQSVEHGVAEGLQRPRIKKAWAKAARDAAKAAREYTREKNRRDIKAVGTKEDTVQQVQEVLIHAHQEIQKGRGAYDEVDKDEDTEASHADEAEIHAVEAVRDELEIFLENVARPLVEEDNVDQLKQNLKKAEGKVAELEKAVALHHLKDHHGQSLFQQDQSLPWVWRSDLDLCSRNLEEKQEKLKELTSQIQQSDALLRHKSAAVEEIKLAAQWREKSKSKAVEEKDAIIATQSRLVEENNALIVKLEAQLREKSKAVEEKDAIIATQSRPVEENDALIVKLEAQLREKSKAVEEKDAIIATQSRPVEENNALMVKLDALERAVKKGRDDIILRLSLRRV